MVILFLLTNLRLASVELKEKDMKLLSVHTHTFVKIPSYRIQYKNAYYISIEGSELSHANEKQWHKDWFMEWDIVQKEYYETT